MQDEIAGCTSDAFNLGVGLQQSDPLAPLLFYIVLQVTVNTTEVDQDGSIFNKMTEILVHAHNIIISVKEAVLKLEKGHTK